MSFDALGLAPELLRAIADQGYTEPTPIQQQAIPEVLARHDIMGCAQTGTGKTASFTLPILQRLSPQQNSSPSPARHPVRALILTPTRELAAQVHESAVNYGKHMQLRSGVVFGGVDINPQIKVLRGGIEILVATPGRLLDHVQQKTVNLSRVEILVLDEADRMLDMGFMPDIKRILALLPAARQNLLFSATFSEEIRRLAGQFMRNPVSIEVARRNAPAELVTHTVFEVESGAKRALLEYLIQQREMKQVLVFTRTKRDANRLSRELEQDGIAASAIHSDRSQLERMKALEDFKQGTVHVLVATDIAARGIDIEQLPFVINYELPYAAEDYVHRIGRTGRAGCPGEAISLVDAEETRLLDDIEKLLKRPLQREPLPAFSRRGGGDRNRSRDHGRPERERPAHAQRSTATQPAAPAPQAARTPQPAAGGFDFSRPYEPATAGAGNDTAAPRPAAVRGRPARPVAALLGGFKKT